MKRFAFRLEQVLSLKKQRERLAELRQMQARLILDAAHAEVHRLQGLLAQVAEALSSNTGREAVSWMTRYQQATQLGQLIQTAQARAEGARKKLLEAERLRTQAALEVETLQTLRREEWQTYQHDLARHEQEQADEAGLRRWRAQTDAEGM